MTRATLAMAVFAAAAVGLAGGYFLGSGRQQADVQTQTSAAPEAQQQERKILYYRNPMGLPDTSPVPKKDQMGMDYIPVYEGEAPVDDGGAVKVSADRMQKLGVRTETAAVRDLARTVRAVGTLRINERRQYTLAPKFEGWIEVLHVNATGEAVAKGQPLMDIYSPELVSAQQEYAIAQKGLAAIPYGNPEAQAGMRRLAESTLARLRNWDISEEQLEQLQRDPGGKRLLTLKSPASGVVMEKKAVEGMRFMPGEVLYRIADLSLLWLVADVFEQDLSLIQVGEPVRVLIDSYPDRVFEGKVAFIYPFLNPETRTGQVRIELPNPQRILKPDMYANVELRGAARRALAVPDSAVIDSGRRQVVLVARAQGRFEPRKVKTGARGDGFVEILDGVSEGELVVVSANFLIDAESNLKAALAGFGEVAGDDGKPAAPATMHKGEGTVQAVNRAGGSFTMTHEPIASLNWPAMTMDFQVKDKDLLAGIKPGQKVEVEIEQGRDMQFQVTRIVPLPAAGKASTQGSHQGH
jgi:Cu(I)/Ag(I) efflux system membrane fusion protein